MMEVIEVPQTSEFQYQAIFWEPEGLQMFVASAFIDKMHVCKIRIQIWA